MTRSKAITVAAILVIVAVVLFMIGKSQKQVALGIVQAPDPLLHQVAETVSEIDEEARIIAAKLIDVLEELDHPLKIFGLGMAAPQIGHSKRIAVVKRSYGDYQIMVNPKVVEQKWNVPFISTCFSLKGLHVLKRSLWVNVHYTDLNNVEHEEVFRWGKATVLQQEVDHLNGVLLSDL